MRQRPQTYALTAVCRQRLRIFQRHANANLLIATLLRYRDTGRFLLHGFVIMPDHIHLLLTPTDPIEKTAGLIKGGFSFAARAEYKGGIWQPSYFAHRVTDSRDYDAQLTYIAANPSWKDYVDYPFVHTTGQWHLDPPPNIGAPE